MLYDTLLTLELFQVYSEGKAKKALTDITPPRHCHLFSTQSVFHHLSFIHRLPSQNRIPFLLPSLWSGASWWSLHKDAKYQDNHPGRWTLLPNKNNAFWVSLATLRNPFLGLLSSLHPIICCEQGQAHFTQISPVVRLCPVATVTHGTIVIVEEEIEAARNQLLSPREKDQDHPSKGKMP